MGCLPLQPGTLWVFWFFRGVNLALVSLRTCPDSWGSLCLSGFIACRQFPDHMDDLLGQTNPRVHCVNSPTLLAMPLSHLQYLQDGRISMFHPGKGTKERGRSSLETSCQLLLKGLRHDGVRVLSCGGVGVTEVPGSQCCFSSFQMVSPQYHWCGGRESLTDQRSRWQFLGKAQ